MQHKYLTNGIAESLKKKNEDDEYQFFSMEQKLKTWTISIKKLEFVGQQISCNKHSSQKCSNY